MGIVRTILDSIFRPKHASGNAQPKLLPNGNQPNWKNRYDFKVGDSDHSGLKITKIHQRSPGNYLIYETSDSKLRFIVEDTTVISKNVDFIILWLKIADYLDSDETLKETYNSYLSFAVKALHDENPATAFKVLTSAHDNITRRLKRRTVLPYLTGAFAPVLFSLIVYLFVYLGNRSNYVSSNFKLNEFGYMIFSAVTFSSIGGVLSVAISLKNLNVDVQDNVKMKAVYGFIRIIIAMISGVIAYFLIEGRVAFGFLKDLQNINTYYIAFFVSGFSEKLVSNMLFDFETKGTKTALDKKSD